MHVARADQAALPVHRLTAELAPTSDRGLTLRIVSLLHQRGVALVEMHLSAPDGSAGGADAQPGPPSQLIVCFRSTEQHARVVHAGLSAVVNVLTSTLELDVRSHRSAGASERSRAPVRGAAGPPR